MCYLNGLTSEVGVQARADAEREDQDRWREWHREAGLETRRGCQGRAHTIYINCSKQCNSQYIRYLSSGIKV